MGLGIRGGRRCSDCDLWRKGGDICNAIMYFDYVVIFVMWGCTCGISSGANGIINDWRRKYILS